MNITRQDVMCGAVKSFEGHGSKVDVKKFNINLDRNIDVLYKSLLDGSYTELLTYRQLVKVNKSVWLYFQR